MTSDVMTLGRLLPTTNKIHENKIDVLCDFGVGGQRGRVYNTNGIIGALSATDYKQPPSVIIRENDE